KPVEINVAYVSIAASVRYDEEDMPKDFPGRDGDMWNVTVDIDTGQIQDWPGIPEEFKLHMKVCDCGSYYLLDENDNVLAKRENEYVPELIPGDFGDYIV